MKKWLYAGAALLIVQLVLAFVLHHNEQDFAAFTPQAKLFDFTPHEIDALLIQGQDKQVEINRENGKWLLPGLFKAPADSKKINEILKKLAGLKQGLAVAVTSGSDKRFKVAEDNFERHIVLKKGGEPAADFFLGTSPGFKSIHARLKGHEEVITLNLSSWELEPKADSWLDRNMLKIDQDKITGLKMGDIALSRTDDTWSMAGLGEDEELNREEIKKLVTKVASLTIAGVLDPAANQEKFKEKPELTITLVLDGPEKRVYDFVKEKDKDEYTLKSSGHDFYFKVHGWLVDDIKKFKRKSLIAKKEEKKDSQGS